MDVLQRTGVPCATGHAVDDCTSSSQSPDYFSSDAASQFSLDSSASSQESVASSASSVSTSWKDVLDQQQEDTSDPEDKIREYVSSVAQVAHTWANGSERSQSALADARGGSADGAVAGAPLGAVFGSETPSRSCSGLSGLNHRKTLSCITDVRPTKPPSEYFYQSRSQVGLASGTTPGSQLSQGTCQQGQETSSLFAEPQKPHPRRSCVSSGFVKPTLRREHERHEINVEHLVDSSASLVAAIWPTALQQSAQKSVDQYSPIISLRSFVRETLKRSRTSHSTLQVTLYYLSLIHSRGLLPRTDFTKAQKIDDSSFRALQCGRRMFLAALILASKYLQDANYSAKAWSKITGLAVPEITKNEVAFLKAIDYRLHVKEADYKDWAEIVKRCTAGPSYGLPQVQAWLNVLKLLRVNYSLPSVNKALICLGPTRRTTGPMVQSQPCPLSVSGRRSSLSLEIPPQESMDCISPQLLTNSQSSPLRSEISPVSNNVATPNRPATAIPPTPLLNQALATPAGISPWQMNRASYTPAASSLSSALSSIQSTPAARFVPLRTNSPCYERVVQRLQRMKSLEKPMGACHISGQPVMGAPLSPQSTIASSSDDEVDSSQPPRTVVSHGLPSPVQSSIASLSDDEESMFGEVRIPETPVTVAEKLPSSMLITPACSQESSAPRRPGTAQRSHTESDIGLGSLSSPSRDVFENVRNLLFRERSAHCTAATPRLPQTMLSAHKAMSRKREASDEVEHTTGMHKLRRITSNSK